MAVIRLEGLRMVSLSLTALARGENIAHSIKEILDYKQGSSKIPGIDVVTVCGSTIVGAVPISRESRSRPAGGYPTYRSSQPVRVCAKCSKPGILMVWQLDRPWPWREAAPGSGQLI